MARHLLDTVVAVRGIRDLDDEQDVARLQVTIGVSSSPPRATTRSGCGSV
jgi:hypothetical protein